MGIVEVGVNLCRENILVTEQLLHLAYIGTSFEQMLPGGKGLNVSFVLKNLGFDTTALGNVLSRWKGNVILPIQTTAKKTIDRDISRL